ncbi:hypothetical protein HispidOSU_016646 [Sigmodon hispidus]
MISQERWCRGGFCLGFSGGESGRGFAAGQGYSDNLKALTRASERKKYPRKPMVFRRK